ncbi:MAG TPA: cation transporter [Gemmatimonadales bacterium]|nr:cation transporter [Gemmatimonadales bacterium]
MSSTNLKIEGMSCGHCVSAVRKALEGLDGVTVENVAVGSATVSFDPAVASEEQIAGAVSEAGYAATVA